MNKIGIYIKSILIPLLVGILVGLLTSNSMNYEELIQPFFAPPSFLFPIVWTILYILMGVSYGILKSNDLTDKKIDSIYYLQLAVNAIWPFLFFVFKLRGLAFLWIVLLIFLVVIMIIDFYNKKKIAGLIQIPYLLWLLFAMILNLSVYILNN